MSHDIVIPAATASDTDITLLRWLKAEGDAVRRGEILAEVETDKAIMDLEAEQDGLLAAILVPAGTSGVSVGTIVGRLAVSGASLAASAASAASSPAASATSPPAIAAVVSAISPPAGPSCASRAGSLRAAPRDPARVPSSPSARKLARENGIDISAITGSGPRGRIVRQDVLREAERKEAAFVPARVPHSGMRRTIAHRLGEAVRTIPHFSLQADFDATQMLLAREQVNALAVRQGQAHMPGRLPGAGTGHGNGQGNDHGHASGAAPGASITDFLVKATAHALRAVPELNASWNDEGMELHADVDVAVAVSTPAGLVTPVVRRADMRGLLDISAAMRGLAQRARDGLLKPGEYQGGSITISNLGMYGVRSFTAIINPPQAAILAVGEVEQRPVVHHGQLVARSMMSVTVSVDHRVADGAVAARFLAALRQAVEQPYALLA